MLSTLIIDDQHPIPFLPKRKMYHVGNCDKREGSQTVREFTYIISVRDSRIINYIIEVCSQVTRLAQEPNLRSSILNLVQ